MSKLTPTLSRVLKPYHTHELHYEESLPTLDDQGHLAFSPGDVENPKNWSSARRWWISFASVVAVINATFASSAPSGILQGISAEFGVTRQIAGLTITLFLLGYCAGPMVFAPLSEYYGRRWLLYLCMILYVVFNFLCAFTQNFAGLLVGRFLTGTFASSTLSNAPAIMADIWDNKDRGKAMAFFTIMLQIGPALAPIVSGFLQLTIGWRWCFYVLIIFGAFSLLFIFTIPETYEPVLLRRKAERIRAARIPGFEDVLAPAEADGGSSSLVSILSTALLRPWRILFDPISFCVAVYITFLYTLIYMLFSIYPIIYQQHRHWNVGIGQLPVLATGIGGMIGGAIIFYYEHKTSGNDLGRPRRPEDRLPIAMIPAVLFPGFLFWFAWAGNFNYVHWIVPPIAGTCVSLVIVIIFNSFTNYLVDTYKWYAASAIAINTVCRSASAASAPLWTGYMFDALGVGVGGSVLGAVAAALAIMPFVFYKYGERIRARSKFAPTVVPPPPQDEEAEVGGDHGAESRDPTRGGVVGGSSSEGEETLVNVPPSTPPNEREK
ncbi:MFS transporter [Apiospora saccharicola]|uniref:MFS transporter n=1 Tax=Apiospora saccharicola TaxID=335842 RepID=A0ABR1TL73_9PEZI